jgi:hypothetical protein
LTTIDFHGIAIGQRQPLLPGDGLESVFRWFPANRRSAVDVQVSARRIDMPVEPAWKGLQPVFHLGPLQAWLRPDGYLLSDGQSWVTVDLSGHRLHLDWAACGEAYIGPHAQGLQHLGFLLLLREYGVFALHAGAVVFTDRAILIPGGCGAGKTTTCLAAMAAGASFMSDDKVLLRTGSHGVELLAYPRQFHVDARTASAFPQYRRLLSHEPFYGQKFALPVDNLCGPGPVLSWLGQVEIWLPAIELGLAQSELADATQADTFGSLLEASALTTVDGVEHRDEHLRALRDVVLRSRAFRLRLGGDLLSAPAKTFLGLCHARRCQPSSRALA